MLWIICENNQQNINLVWSPKSLKLCHWNEHVNFLKFLKTAYKKSTLGSFLESNSCAQLWTNGQFTNYLYNVNIQFTAWLYLSRVHPLLILITRTLYWLEPRLSSNQNRVSPKFPAYFYCNLTFADANPRQQGLIADSNQSNVNSLTIIIAGFLSMCQ